MSGDRSLCKHCGKNKTRYKGKRNGKIRYHPDCSVCYAARRKAAGKRINKGPSLRKRFLKPACESCGFTPVHPIQLHLDHKDGNTAHNKPSNFQTLCANCHALKTWVNGDWRTPSKRPVDGSGTQQLCLIH